ncbi:DDE domain-containing protein [Staphylococcus saprophyticus]|nr:DDE domain-containing protein [Staphylococcus saprophyticus]
MGYQSEYGLEENAVKQLQDLGYERVSLRNETQLIENFRRILNERNADKLEGTPISDSEFKRLIKQFGKPQKVITNQAPSTKVAMAKVIKAFKLKPDCHCTSRYLNNLIEQDHRHIKVRKTRYQSINTAKNTLKEIECIYALYKKNRRSLQIYGFSPCHEISIMLAS